MLKKLIVIAALGSVSALAVATEMDARNAAKQVIDLKDGATVFVFDNGKMGYEDRLGNAVRVEPGTSLLTTDGRTIAMNGDEVARLDLLLRQGERGNTNPPTTITK